MLPLLFALIAGLVVSVVYYRRNKLSVTARLQVIDTAVEAKLKAAGVDLEDVSTIIFTTYRDLESRGEIEVGETQRYVENRIEWLKNQASGLAAKL
jgi:hypothetical protein